jgi:Nuclease-related domain
MRIIEKCWVDLSAGYQTAISLESSLRSEWRRAIQVAQRRESLAVKSGQGQRLKIAGIAFSAFLFICVSLWVAQLFLPKHQLQLWLYICALTFPGVISGGFFLFYLSKSLRKTVPDAHPSLKLTEQWWRSLRPKSYIKQKGGDDGELDFLHSLSFLDESFIAVWGLLTSAKITSDTDVLLLGPTGIWVFEVKSWKGKVSKRDGTWSRVFDGERTVYPKSPDEQWLDQRDEIVKTIKIRLPTKAWLTEIIQGGVVFVHPRVEFGQIDDHTASYGKPGVWHKRIKTAQPVNGFGVKERLQVLDALITYANLHEREDIKIVSASDTAEQLYSNASVALRDYVIERVR